MAEAIGICGLLRAHSESFGFDLHEQSAQCADACIENRGFGAFQIREKVFCPWIDVGIKECFLCVQILGIAKATHDHGTHHFHQACDIVFWFINVFSTRQPQIDHVAAQFGRHAVGGLVCGT